MSSRTCANNFHNALLTATSDELEAAKAICQQLSRILDNSDTWRQVALADADGLLRWRPIKLAGLLWQSPLTRAGARAVTVALAILLVPASKNRFEEVATAVVTIVTSAFPRAKS
jgi:hypothetical protein